MRGADRRQALHVVRVLERALAAAPPSGAVPR
jgi:hypothetical protein